MRTFVCLTLDAPDAIFTQALVILAEDEWRARELVRRELAEPTRPVPFQICEGGRLLCAGVAPASMDAFHDRSSG